MRVLIRIPRFPSTILADCKIRYSSAGTTRDYFYSGGTKTSARHSLKRNAEAKNTLAGANTPTLKKGRSEALIRKRLSLGMLRDRLFIGKK